MTAMDERANASSTQRRPLALLAPMHPDIISAQ